MAQHNPDQSDFDLFGGYAMWGTERLTLEAERRGHDLPIGQWSHTELCALLVADDDGTLASESLAAPKRVALPF